MKIPALFHALAVPSISVLLAACQGEYPIAPTLCDELCHAQDNVKCGSWLENPAECVLQCEAVRVTNGPDCDQLTALVVSCLQALPPGNDYCRELPCSEQYDALWRCQSARAEF